MTVKIKTIQLLNTLSTVPLYSLSTWSPSVSIKQESSTKVVPSAVPGGSPKTFLMVLWFSIKELNC